MPMKAQIVRSHPYLTEDHSKLAVVRGPIVYCIEDKDNGGALNNLSIKTDSKMEEKFIPDFLHGCMVLDVEGYRVTEKGFENKLYNTQLSYEFEPTTIRFIPYYTWSNRGNGEMQVWVWEKR
jgi:DUF1680 family protein